VKFLINFLGGKINLGQARKNQQTLENLDLEDPTPVENLKLEN
jgi:hypothetical protein